MSELLNFPATALAVPAADIRMLADLLVSMQQACAEASVLLIERLDNYDGDPDLENATDIEDDHSGGDVCDERHDPLDEDGC